MLGQPIPLRKKVERNGSGVGPGSGPIIPYVRTELGRKMGLGGADPMPK